MKKILTLIVLLLTICGCKTLSKQDNAPNQRYFSLIDAIKERDNFVETSNYFDINVEMATINEGYRYYVTIDNPRTAMYDVEAVAIEKEVDYTNKMAASIGLFDETAYSMIPNQKNPNKGFVSGVVMSGTTTNPETTLYIFVSFKNEDHSLTYSEYIKLDVKFGNE